MNKWSSFDSQQANPGRPSFRPFSNLIGLSRLVLLFIGALSVTLLVTDDNAVADILFQSPASPLVDPSGAQPPVIPPETQPAVDPAEAQPPVTPPEVQSAIDPSGSQSPVDPAGAQPPVPGQPVESGSTTETTLPVSPLQQPGDQAPALAPPPFPENNQSERTTQADDEAEDSSNLVLDQAEFIDTVLVSTAYVWLCCGIVLLLLIPLVFLFLQIRGRMKLVDEENY
jgi:hypothetical protein